MTALVLHLAGPLQAWGVDGRFNTRPTLDHPSKSGVIGLLAAALGRRRGQPLGDLAGLHMAVRVDNPGETLVDFHTVTPSDEHPVTKSNGKRHTDTIVTRRHYLSGARFTVALAGDADLLEECAAAVQAPVFPLFLGRRSCPASSPIVVALAEGDPRELLTDLPAVSRRAGAIVCKVVEDAIDGPLVQDLPVKGRTFAMRPVSERRITVATVPTFTELRRAAAALNAKVPT